MYHRFVRKWLTNSSRVHLFRHNKAFALDVTDDMFVLDAGAGTAPYRSLFEHAHYETADFEKVEKAYTPSTYVCDLASIPVEDGRFDRVVFNQVLEHLPDPLSVLRELHRTLKPGGKLLCTCPFFYEEHEQPFDFYRYTQFAHKHLFEQSKFEIEKIEWMEGYLGTVGYKLECIYRFLPVDPRKLGPGLSGWLASPFAFVVKFGALVMAGVFYRLDCRQRLITTGFPKNYLIIARKPG
jgi:SAM-dependent methyltransferase